MGPNLYGAAEVQWEDVTLPDGETVKLPFRTMRQAAINKWRRMAREAGEMKGEEADIHGEAAQAFLLSQSLCDENGELLPAETTVKILPGYAEAIAHRILVSHKLAKPIGARKEAPAGNG